MKQSQDNCSTILYDYQNSRKKIIDTNKQKITKLVREIMENCPQNQKTIVYGIIKPLITRYKTDLRHTIGYHKSTIRFKYNNVDELENEVQESLKEIQSFFIKKGDELVKLIKALQINNELKNLIEEMLNKALERHQESSNGTYAQFIKDQEENKEEDRSPQL